MTILTKAVLVTITAALLAALCIVGVQRARIDTLASKLSDAQIQAITAKFDAQSADLNAASVALWADRLVDVHDTTVSLQLKVPEYVPPSVDRAFPLSVGFVRLHDAAANLSELPSPGPADAEASPIAASTAASTIVTNYGTCHETAEQLIALQEWEMGRQALEDNFRRSVGLPVTAQDADTP
jgi:outer membrane murein-binding lipoprotein Lpp